METPTATAPDARDACRTCGAPVCAQLAAWAGPNGAETRGRCRTCGAFVAPLVPRRPVPDPPAASDLDDDLTF
jgi:hypothetical protein